MVVSDEQRAGPVNKYEEQRMHGLEAEIKRLQADKAYILHERDNYRRALDMLYRGMVKACQQSGLVLDKLDPIVQD